MAYLCPIRGELYLTDQEDRMAQLREDRDRRIQELEEELEEIQEYMDRAVKARSGLTPGCTEDMIQEARRDRLAIRYEALEGELESLRKD